MRGNLSDVKLCKAASLLPHPPLALGSSVLDPVAREKLSKEVSPPVEENGGGGNPGEWGDIPQFSERLGKRKPNGGQVFLLWNYYDY